MILRSLMFVILRFNSRVFVVDVTLKIFEIFLQMNFHKVHILTYTAQQAIGILGVNKTVLKDMNLKMITVGSGLSRYTRLRVMIMKMTTRKMRMRKRRVSTRIAILNLHRLMLDQVAEVHQRIRVYFIYRKLLIEFNLYINQVRFRVMRGMTNIAPTTSGVHNR